MSTPRSSILALFVCALSAVLVFSPGCEPDRPLPGGGDPLPPGGKDNQGGDDGGTDGGVLVVRSDGGTFGAKPTCPSGTPCEGACPDGGVICAGNCGFLAPVQYTFAGDPKAIAMGDVDKDGDDDIVTANNDGRAVAVLLNRRNGLFQTPSLWTAGREPMAVALADVNEDGSLDLLVANSGDSSIGVHRGRGTGDFQAPITTTGLGLNLKDLVAGRFGANVWSLALLSGSEQPVSVFPLKSDGTPQLPADYAASSGAYALVAADFNGDGKLDLALSHETACNASSSTPCESVGVLLGKGDGTFDTNQLLTTTGGSPRGLVAARLDTDAVLDLVVADAKRNQVLVLRGQNNGRFYEPVAYPTVSAPSRVVLADVNRDFVQDLLVVSATGNKVGLLLGQSGGTFSPQVPLTAWPQDVGLQGLSASDFDGDNFVDMAVLTRNGIQLLWGICR